MCCVCDALAAHVQNCNKHGSQKMCEKESSKVKSNPTQPRNADVFSRCISYDKESKPQRELTEAVAFCLAKDMLSL